MRFFFILFLVLGGLVWLGYSCVSGKGKRLVPSRPATSPVHRVTDAPKQAPAPPVPSTPPGYCPNWGSASSGPVWGWDTSGQYHEGQPRFWMDGNPVF